MNPCACDQQDVWIRIAQSLADSGIPITEVRTDGELFASQKPMRKVKVRIFEAPMPVRFRPCHEPYFESPTELAQSLMHPAKEKKPVWRRNIAQANKTRETHGAYKLSRTVPGAREDWNSKIMSSIDLRVQQAI